MKKLLTTKEASKVLKLNQATVRRLAREGKLPAIRVGGTWRIVMDKLEQQGGVAEERCSYESQSS